MTRDEYQAQHVVSDVVIHSSGEIRHLHLAFGHFAPEDFMLALSHRAVANVVDGSMFRRPHEPRAWILWNAGFRPLLECYDQGVLGEFFRHAHVMDVASQPGNHPSRLHLPDSFNRVMCLGSAHLPITSFSRPS